LIVKGNITGKIGVKGEVTKTFQKNYTLASPKYSGYVLLGKVPCSFDIALPTDFEISANATGSFEYSKSVSFQTNYGTTYTKANGWEYITERTLNDEKVFKYEIQGEISAKLSMGLVCEVRLAGLIGPTVTPEVYIKLDSKWNNQNLWDLGAKLAWGMDMDLAVTFKLWNWKVQGFDRSETIISERALWEGKVPFYTTIEGLILDSDTDQPVDNANVGITVHDGRDVANVKASTDSTGAFSLKVPVDLKDIIISKDGYDNLVVQPVETLHPNQIFEYKFSDSVYSQGTLKLLPGLSLTLTGGDFTKSLPFDQDSFTHTFEAIATPRGNYTFRWVFGGGQTVNDSPSFGAKSTVAHTFTALKGGDTLNPGVELLDASGKEIAARFVTITIEQQENPVSPPTNPVATAGDGEVTLSWSNVADADSYNIYWANSPGVGKTANKITGVASPFVHSSLTNDLQYYYVITAQNSLAESNTSQEVSATPVFIQTYSVIYDGNGNDSGNVPTDPAKYLTGQSATVLDNAGALARTYETFVDWNTSSDGLGTSYSSGAEIEIGSSNMTLYAQYAIKSEHLTVDDGTVTGLSAPPPQGLKELNITPNMNITKIADGAFMNLGLTTVRIPEGVHEIGASAFFGNKITLMVIPESVRVIGAGGLQGIDYWSSISTPVVRCYTNSITFRFDSSNDPFKNAFKGKGKYTLIRNDQGGSSWQYQSF
jgi:hypothetical protein